MPRVSNSINIRQVSPFFIFLYHFDLNATAGCSINGTTRDFKLGTLAVNDFDDETSNKEIGALQETSSSCMTDP